MKPSSQKRCHILDTPAVTKSSCKLALSTSHSVFFCTRVVTAKGHLQDVTKTYIVIYKYQKTLPIPEDYPRGP